jgi:hypothetical protein
MDFLKFPENTQLIFLDTLRRSERNVTMEILKKVDEDYHFTTSVDPKIK